MNRYLSSILLAIVMCCAALFLATSGVDAWNDGTEANEVKDPTRLAVLWTSDDPLLAHRMLLMYVGASQRAKWFDENVIIVWGPSAKLVAEDEEIQAKIRSMMKSGVKFKACIACANLYGVVDDLRALGIEVKGMGAPLTKILQDDGWEILTL